MAIRIRIGNLLEISFGLGATGTRDSAGVRISRRRRDHVGSGGGGGGGTQPIGDGNEGVTGRDDRGVAGGAGGMGFSNSHILVESLISVEDMIMSDNVPFMEQNTNNQQRNGMLMIEQRTTVQG